MTDETFNPRFLQEDYFVKSQKFYGQGPNSGLTGWLYRLKCKHCGSLSRAVENTKRAIPKILLLTWAPNHNCRAKKQAKSKAG